MFEQSFVVVGCDKLEPTTEAFRFADGSRAVEIGWSMLEGGGIAVKDRNSAAPLPQGDPFIASAMRQYAAVRATHDALWIKSGIGLIIALIEQSHPKRDALLKELEQRLKSHWYGETFTSAELAQRFAYKSRPARAGLGGLGKPILFMGAAMLIILAAIIAVTLLR